jgi:IS1 family transposase
MFLMYLRDWGVTRALRVALGFGYKIRQPLNVLLPALYEMNLKSKSSAPEVIPPKKPEPWKIFLDIRDQLTHNCNMNRLSREKQTQIVASLVEGNSMRATARICDVSFNSVLNFLPKIGMACAEYQDKVLRGLKCKRVQADEIWSFCYAKDKNVPADKQGKFGFGSVWTWVAIDADTKLVPSFMIGNRDALSAKLFIEDLASRLASRVQLTTDGLKVYLEAIEGAFGCDVDYAMLVKTYESSQEETRYSPAVCTSCERKPVMGQPDPAHISTSYVERQNLTMRMGMRRFTRLTNAFSKKVEHHAYQVALHYMHYNFVRIHKTLRVTPAMEAGVTERLWTVEDIVNLLPTPVFKPRGPYKKRNTED